MRAAGRSRSRCRASRRRPTDIVALLNRVSPGYFETLGTRRVERARVRRPRHTVGAARRHRQPRLHAPIPRRRRSDRHALQHRRRRRAGAIEIVGLVEDAKYDSPRRRAADGVHAAAADRRGRRRCRHDGVAVHPYHRSARRRQSGVGGRRGATDDGVGRSEHSGARGGHARRHVGQAIGGDSAVATLAAFFGPWR